MVTYKLHLLRHGMTVGSLEGRYVGRNDQPLCREGVEELENLLRTREYPAVQEVYCSPLTRCRQTAELLYPDTPLTVVEDLTELSMGDFEGRGMEDLADTPAYRDWLADSAQNPPPGALETVAQFNRRIGLALHHIFVNMTQNSITEAAAVTHGGVVMGLLSSFGLPRRPMGEWAAPFCCGYTLRMSTGLWMRDNVVEVVGAVPE